jgi:hypothetical protein
VLRALTALLCAVGGLTAVTAPAHAVDIGTGATLPYIEQQAENAATNGTKIGPDRTFTHLASEASERKAVTLDAQGEYVEFTLTQPANSLVLRYSLPDSADGKGIDAPLSLYVNGQKSKDLQLTSRYGWYYGGYPYSNNPGDGNAHHFYDDVRTLLPDLPAGTKVRVQVDAGDNVPSYTVDLADFEQVAPAGAQPSGSLSITDYGADATGATEASDAIDATIAAAKAQGRTVWIPRGTFKVTRHIVVDQVTVKGAGPWYSVLSGKGVGVYGKWAPDLSTGVHLADFAIWGDTTERNDSDQVNGIGGTLGGGSTIDDLWIEHTKVGMWFDGPFDGLTISNCRLRDFTADGLNFHKGITNSVVQGTHVRNSGDDGLAMWAESATDSGDTFRNNTVEIPVLANGIAVYGGKDISVTDNLVKDTVTQGGGIHVGNRFSAVPVAGTITLARNRTVRAGVLDPNWQFGVGALWFYSLDAPMSATINVTDTELVDSSYEAIHFIGNSAITNVHFSNVTITGAGTFALQLQTTGSATFDNVTATGLGAAGVYDCQGAGAFTVTKGAGDTGWDSSYCGPWPDPSTPAPGGLTVTPGSLDFGSQDIGTTSTGKQVTVKNTGSAAVTVDSVTAGGDFTAASGCGSSIAAGATCTVTAAFRPTATGTRSGTLTIAGSAAGSPTTVALTGTGTDPGGNLALNRPMSATSANGPYTAANAADGNAATYWESANNAFPQDLTADLGSARTAGNVTLKLPPDTAWATRTQTLSVLGSTDGSTYGTLVASNSYTFDPASGNKVSVDLPSGTTARYLRLHITANTGWPAGQVSEFEAYATAQGDNGGGGTPDPGNVAIGKPVTATSTTDVYSAGRAVDGNADSYWESANNAFPQSFTVDLGATTPARRLVLKLPPATAWAARTQTLSVLGSTDGSSYATLVASKGYAFDPASGNTVTVTLPATTDARYLRLTFTGNTGWPAAQLGELEAYTS